MSDKFLLLKANVIRFAKLEQKVTEESHLQAKPQIIACVFNNLATDQRVEKVCQTLHQAGYPLLLIGNDRDGTPEMQRPYPFKRLHLKYHNLKAAYPEFNVKLYRYLKTVVNKNTLLICNDLDLLAACFEIAEKKGIPLIYDSHEIFTEMPYIQGRFTQKIWRYLENKFIREVPFMMTESHSYADWFVRKYGIKKPTVVSNFPRRNFIEHKKKQENHRKVIIYQGAVNPYRGLESAISAMKFLSDCELWIVGEGPQKVSCEQQVQKEGLNNVCFFGSVSPEKLRTITPRADVGISIEENAGLSYYYSLPNKVADYIQAGIPLVGSDFPETGRVIKDYQIGTTIENHDPAHLANKIREVLEKPAGFYTENLRKAADELCWEVQEENILQLFKEAGERLG